MSALTRLAVGSVGLESAVALADLSSENWQNFVLNPQEVLSVPVLRLVSDVEKVRQGQPLFLSDLAGADDFQKGQPVFVKNEKEEFLAWGRLADSVSALRQNPRQPALICGRVLV
jgi:tRNA U55 pseudouridine synthase TruB